MVVARLMAADLRPLKEGSLDEIARLMADIRRRLGHAEAGRRVRAVQTEVVEKLDRLIERDGGDGPRVPGPPNPKHSGRPADDSLPGGVKGEGNVDLRKLPPDESWGDLPPAERQAVLQQITRDLPAHYREVVEAYFRRLARDGAK